MSNLIIETDADLVVKCLYAKCILVSIAHIIVDCPKCKTQPCAMLKEPAILQHMD